MNEPLTSDTLLRLEDSLPNGKPVDIDFEGGDLSSDGGVLLLQKVEERLGLAERMAGCLVDMREPAKIKHSLVDLLRTRIFLIAEGYEDCNDANSMRHDPLFKMALGRSPQDELEALPANPHSPALKTGCSLTEKKSGIGISFSLVSCLWIRLLNG